MNYPQWLGDEIFSACSEAMFVVLPPGDYPIGEDITGKAAQAIQARFEQALSADDKQTLSSVDFGDPRSTRARNDLRAEARKRWMGHRNPITTPDTQHPKGL